MITWDRLGFDRLDMKIKVRIMREVEIERREKLD